MISFKYGLFDGEGELTDYQRGKGYETVFTFPKEVNGFLTLGDVSLRVKDGRGCIDMRLLEDGAHIPKLIEKDRQISLPGIRKQGRIIEPAECGSDYVRRISLRERALAERVLLLEDAVSMLYEKVYGKSVL